MGLPSRISQGDNTVRIIDSKAVDVNGVDSKAVDFEAVDTKSVVGDATPPMYTPISEADLRTRVAQNIRNHRALQGMSQEALADLAGVHRTFVSQVERELKNFSLDSLRKLANALQVDPAELLKPRAD